jgi:hypothetical protein
MVVFGISRWHLLTVTAIQSYYNFNLFSSVLANLNFRLPPSVLIGQLAGKEIRRFARNYCSHLSENVVLPWGTFEPVCELTLAIQKPRHSPTGNGAALQEILNGIECKL